MAIKENEANQVTYSMLIPKELFIRWKVEAAKKETTMKEIVLQLLQEYLKKA